MLLWTRRVKFWRTCPNCFTKHPKVFSQLPENMKSITTYSLQKHHLASKCCYRNAECCFDNTGNPFPGSSPRTFSSNLKTTKKFLLLMKKKFRPKRFLWSHEKQFQTTLPEIFRSKKCNKSKTFIFCTRKTSKNVPLDT